MNKISKYESSNWYSVIYNNTDIKIVTKEDINLDEDFMYLPKKLISFILELENLPSPLPFTLVTLDKETWWLVDMIWYSPDEQRGILFFKDVYYITR